jgi:hypothetical protein
MASVSTLVDDFAGSALGAPWVRTGVSPETVAGGQLSLPCTSSYSGVQSVATYDLTNSECVLRWSSAPAAGNGGTEASFELTLDANNSVRIEQNAGGLWAMYQVAGVTTYDDISSGYNFGSPNDSTWWRIRHAAGHLFFDTSVDGVRWTNRASKATPFAITALKVTLWCGYYGTETTPGPFVVEAVNPTSRTARPRALDVGAEWNGDLLSSWANQSAYAGTTPDAFGDRCTQVTVDGRNALAMKCKNTDVFPLTPNTSPRAQLVSSLAMIDPGEVYRVQVEMKVPTGAFSAFSGSGNWLQFVQWAYGRPFAGSPALRIITRDGANIGVQEQDATMRWSTAIPWDTWMTFVMTYKLHPGEHGWYELKYGTAGVNGPLSIIVPRRKWTTQYASHNAGTNQLYINTYMSATTPLSTVGPVYFANCRVKRLQEKRAAVLA